MQKYLKLSLLLSLFLAIFSFAFAATYHIGDGIGSQRFPFGHFYDYERSASLYTASEIGAVGSIEKIGWDCEFPGTVPVPYKIYVGTTTETELPLQTFTALIQNMELVHEGSHTFSSTGWNIFELTNPFEYLGGNLIVAVQIDFTSYSSSELFHYTDGHTNKHMYWQADIDPSDTVGYRDGDRPNLLLELGTLGGDPQLTVDTTVINFANAVFGATMGYQNINLSNSGGGTLTIEAENVSFAGSDQFSYDTTVFPIVLGSAEILPIPVAITGTVEGTATGTITISYDGVDHEVALSANVLPEGLVIIGDDSYNRNMPISPYHEYSYVQTLYKADELMHIDRRIDKIAYHWNGESTGANCNQWTVYMGHTTKEAFTSETDWIALDDLTQVFYGRVGLSATDQWAELAMQTRFVYNGQDNLVIAVREAEPGYESSSSFFYSTDSSEGRSLRYLHDDNVPNPATPPAGYPVSAYPNIKFFFVEDTPKFSVSPKSTRLTNVLPNATSATKNITITNIEGGQLGITAITINGDDEFTLGNLPTLPVSIGENQSISFDVIFSATSVGEYSATVTITDDQNSRDEHNVTLTGTCFDAATLGIPVTLGDGNFANPFMDGPTPYGTFQKNFRQQYLIRASELIDAGTDPFEIEAIAFNVASFVNAPIMPNYRIRMKHTLQEELVIRFETGEYTEVFQSDSFSPTLGWNIHTFSTPFEWDGTSNIIVDIVCALASAAGENARVYFTSNNFNCSSHIASNIQSAETIAKGGVSSQRSNMVLFFKEPEEDPQLSVSTDNIHFNSILNDPTTNAENITITNIGGGQLGISAITILGDDAFELGTLPALPASLGKDESISFDAIFAPTAAGNYSATISITDNLSSRDIHTVSLTGTCFDAAIPGTPVELGENITVTITGAGFVGALETLVDPENLTPIPNPAFSLSKHLVWQLIGTGDATLTFQNNGSEAVWIAYVVGGAWIAEEIPAGGSVEIILSLGSKDASFEFALGKGGNPTLPVELSYFNAVFVANENSVKLNWKTESETQMLGYQIYRSMDKDLVNASLITGTIIDASNSSTGANYSYLDSDVQSGTYYYWLEALSYNSSEFYGYQSVVIDIPSTPELPTVSSMSKAYPNPFKDMTNVDIAIKGGETGSFTIYNMLGQVVYRQSLSEGNVKIEWNGKDSHGNRCGNGVYFYKLTTPTKSETKKMLIMR